MASIKTYHCVPNSAKMVIFVEKFQKLPMFSLIGGTAV